MPIKRGQNKYGNYYKYGKQGKKYYYQASNKISRNTAKNKAKRQGKAIETSKHKKF